MTSAQPTTPAEMYENYFVPAMFRPWADILIGHAVPLMGERVLDIACGTGIVARSASSLVGETEHVAALDFNPAMLAVAKTIDPPSGAGIDWREGSAMALPYADHSFDLVLCQHGLQFFPDKRAAMREMRRVLASTGRAKIMVLQALEKHPVFEALMMSVARQLALPVATVAIPFSLSDDGELKAMARDAGFTTVDVRQVSSTMTFPNAARFVPLAVMSSAAAVPAFIQLQGSARADLLAMVARDVEPVLSHYRFEDPVRFTMHAHILGAQA